MRIIPNFTVAMDIYHVLYLSFLIPAARILSYLPAPLQPAFFIEGKVFLSLVCFCSRNVRVAGIPFVKFVYDQVNIRTYVRDPLTGKNGVLFIFSGIASRFVAVSVNMLGFPWRNIPFRLEARRGSNSLYNHYEAHGFWNGEIDLAFSESEYNTPDHRLEETVRFITSPGIGFYNVKGKPLRFEVEHTGIMPRPVTVRKLAFPLLLSAGLVTDEEYTVPHNAVLADKGVFKIFLPPSRVELDKIAGSHRGLGRNKSKEDSNATVS